MPIKAIHKSTCLTRGVDSNSDDNVVCDGVVEDAVPVTLGVALSGRDAVTESVVVTDAVGISVVMAVGFSSRIVSTNGVDWLAGSLDAITSNCPKCSSVIEVSAIPSVVKSSRLGNSSFSAGYVSRKRTGVPSGTG